VEIVELFDVDIDVELVRVGLLDVNREVTTTVVP